MEAEACLRKVHGSEQRCLSLSALSGVRAYRCHVSGLKKREKAAVFGLCLSLGAEGLADSGFFPSLKKLFKTI